MQTLDVQVTFKKTKWDFPISLSIIPNPYLSKKREPDRRFAGFFFRRLNRFLNPYLFFMIAGEQFPFDKINKQPPQYFTNE